MCAYTYVTRDRGEIVHKDCVTSTRRQAMDTNQLRKEITFMTIRKKIYELEGFTESAEMCDEMIRRFSELLRIKEESDGQKIE